MKSFHFGLAALGAVLAFSGPSIAQQPSQKPMRVRGAGDMVKPPPEPSGSR